jgi:Mg2+ and Co2+ transporter CorA
MWGMNFTTVPLSGWRYGFLVLLVVQLLLGGLLLLYLRRRRWI